jgi:hypothetical protein
VPLDKILDFARVQWNVSLLFVLLILFIHWHVADLYTGAVLGAMVQSMQTQRFSWPKPATSSNDLTKTEAKP